jgi:hypothetical protein
VHRAVLAMTDEDREKKTDPRDPAPRLPPSIRTEYDRLCEDLGAPADIGVEIEAANVGLAIYCNEYPSSRVLPVLLPYQPDISLARKHWPWAAYAMSRYIFEIEERKQYTDEPTSKEVAELLSKIEKSARDLSSGLCQLQTLSNRLQDPAAPLRRAHLSWLDAYVSQAASGDISPTVSEEGLTLLTIDSGKKDFLKRLAQVQAAANHAKIRMDAEMLTRERGQSNPALTNFVFLCGKIWKSLTGRKPSANKVHRRAGAEDPDFVLFIQQLAKIAPTREAKFSPAPAVKNEPAPVPTRNEVAINLRKNFRTRN